jgi:hypothetical protein
MQDVQQQQIETQAYETVIQQLQTENQDLLEKAKALSGNLKEIAYELESTKKESDQKDAKIEKMTEKVQVF